MKNVAVEELNKYVVGLTSGIIGCEPGVTEFDTLLDHFHNTEYLNPDGTENVTPIAKYLTEMCMEKGFKLDNTMQEKDGMTLYPNEYLCPTIEVDKSIVVTDNTRAIHHFTATWLTPELLVDFIDKMKKAKEGEIVV